MDWKKHLTATEQRVLEDLEVDAAYYATLVQTHRRAARTLVKRGQKRMERAAQKAQKEDQ